MRTQRSIRNRGRRDKRGIAELDITSLLDILVILLVFLLKSYNSSGIILNVHKDIKLPISKSISVNTSGVNVMVSNEKIWVDDKVVVNNRKKPSRKLKRIIPLYNELVRKKNTIKQIEKTTPNAKKFSGIINLILDKKLRYSDIRKVMHTCAAAGFGRYKFVVLGEEN